MTYLFEERYRCEHIFPRGRSGEVIQAYDMADGERPVVIKRPVPLDAPPIRARQEANLLMERRALRHLAGHPAMNVLLHSGYFTVSGARHLYLVLEQAPGSALSEAIHLQSAIGQPQGLLELMRIAEQLINLLQHAHERGVVYNDVDARHLFWLRPERHLTVIDWGNAVFYDEAPPNGPRIDIQSDVKQVGEWLFYMLTNGRIPELPRDADAGFVLDFGMESSNLDEGLIAIISRACHPNRRLRYPTIAELGRDLNSYCKPKLLEHDAALQELRNETPETMSADDLDSFRTQLAPLQLADPSEPKAADLWERIHARTAELEFDGNLQATLQAITAVDWEKSEEVLLGLHDTAREEKRSIVSSLSECVRFLKTQTSLLAPLPAPMMIACEAFAAGDKEAAMEALVASDENSDLGSICWSMAEHLQAKVPDIGKYLRPPLLRLGLELQGGTLARVNKLIQELERALAQPQPTLEQLASAYERVATSFSSMRDDIEAVDIPLHTSLDLARAAADSLAKTLQDMAATASNTPEVAREDLARCRQIDHRAVAWPTVEQQLIVLAQLQDEASRYCPMEEGRDLAIWLRRQSEILATIHIVKEDKRLEALHLAYLQAEEQWHEISKALTRGDRRSINELLPEMRTTTRPYFPALTRWLEAWQELLVSENYLQRHALHEAWGSTLADGWLAYDRGNLAEAESKATEALNVADDDEERDAARRLASLLTLVQDLLRDEVGQDSSLAQQLLQQLNAQFQPSEWELLEAFEQQIPQLATYLRAMRVGIVEPLAEISPAASRLLHLRCLLLGILAMQENDAKAAEDWRMAAHQCDLPITHPTNDTLMKLQAARETLWEAATRINQLNGVHGISQLGGSHDYLTAHPKADRLAKAAVSLDAVRTALEAWGRADFTSARESLARAEEAAASTEHICQVNLSPYRAWLHSLVRASQALIETLGEIRGMSRREETTGKELCDATRQLRDRSYRLVGETYSHTVKAWHETSKAFAQSVSRKGRRSLVLAELEGLLRGPHTAQHPALPLFQRWFERIDRAPEFPESEGLTTIMLPRAADDTAPAASGQSPPLRYAFSQPPRAQDEEEYEDEVSDENVPYLEEAPPPEPIRQRRLLLIVLFGAILATVLTIILAILVRQGEVDRVGSRFTPVEKGETRVSPASISSEIDVLAWLTSDEADSLRGLRPLEDREGWELTATSANAATEISLTPDDVLALSETGFRMVSAEFLYQTEAASSGFGLRLRANGNDAPVISLLAQPASGGTIKLTLFESGQFVWREIYSLAAPIARISLRWDPANGEVRALFNETPLGEAFSITGDVLPALFVNADASVRILRWSITPA